MNSVIITGGLGQVGSSIIDQLPKSTHILVLDNYSNNKTTEKNFPNHTNLHILDFDISDINSISEVNRLKNNFDNYYLNQGLYNEDQGVIVGYKEELKEEYIENHDCGLAYD